MAKYPDWFIAELEDKDNVDSIKSTDTVGFICPIHGLYYQKVSNHIRISTGEKTHGCPVCARMVRNQGTIKYHRNKKIKYPQWFISELDSDYDRQRAREGSLRSDEKVVFVCQKHGPYLQQVGVHINITTSERKSGCPICGEERIEESRSRCLAEAYIARMRNLNEHRSYPQWFVDDLVSQDDKNSAINKTLKTSDVVQFNCKIHGPYLQRVGDHITLSLGIRRCGCPECYYKSYRSHLEDDVNDYIQEITGGVTVKKNVRDVIKIGSHWAELDLYYPEVKIAIEIEGSYYHATVGPEVDKMYKDPKYHQEKFINCENVGVHLLSIFDVDFYSNEKKIKMYLKSLFVPNQRVYARKTEIREVSLVDSKKFYNQYHLQGASIGGVISYGLYLNEELLSVMSFGKQRFNPKGEGYYELYRYCVKDGYTIVGGAEKLHKRFLNDYNVKEVVSYSDNDYFLGGIYVKLGYSMECQCNPRYYWWSRDEVYTREQCMLKQLKRRYPDVFERFNNRTGNKEDQIMISKGFYKVYRSGNKRWVLRRG